MPARLVDGIDAQLADAAHLTGTVTGVGGELLPLAAVIAYAWHDGHWDDVGIAFADDTDNGDYDLGGLSPGTYRLEFFSFRIEDDEGNIIGINADEFWNDQPTLELAQDIVISEAGEVLTGYDAVLEEGQYPSDVENLTPPTISGSPVVGQTLTASPGTWNLAATTFHYQWFAGTTPVGTDTPTYAPQAADVGKAITVTVVGSVAGLGSAAATSAPTAAVTGASTPPLASTAGRQADRQPQAARHQGHPRGGPPSPCHHRTVEPRRGGPDLPVVRRRQAHRQVRQAQAGAEAEVGRQAAAGQGDRQGRGLPHHDGPDPAQRQDQVVTGHTGLHAHLDTDSSKGAPMSTDDAGAFLQRLEEDEAFALRMQEVSGNPEATHQRAAEEGFSFTPDEMLEVLGDRYGIELTPEQLEQIAAGGDPATIVSGAVGGTMLAGVVIGAAAASAIF